MKSNRNGWYWLGIVGLPLAVGCGGRSGGKSDTIHGTDPTGVACTDGSECLSGICLGGYCVAPEICTDHSDCDEGQYCHFPTLPDGWVTGTEGICSGPCTDEASCGTIGQECHGYQGYQRCYTNNDCNPANNSADCPPGEVCWQDSWTCKWPPEHCYFNEQCPHGWICDPDGVCVDPNAGECEPTPEGDLTCEEGEYCAGGTCQPATPCPNGQDDCTPFGLICRDGACGNAELCGPEPNYDCPGNLECKLNYLPPRCFPPGTNSCTRDQMCPSGQYCELYTGECEPGCRTHQECETMCPGATFCTCGTEACNSCNADHICTDVPTVPLGDRCRQSNECESGTVCAVDTPGLMGALCQMDVTGLMPGCSKHCYEACDVLTNMIMNTCGQGYVCGSGDVLEDLLALIFGGLVGVDTTASVCYPL